MSNAKNKDMRRNKNRGGVKRHTENARRPQANPAELRGGCPAFPNKVRFRDHKEAIRALHSTEVSAKRARERGAASRRNERRTVDCTACKGYHLTSWETPTSGPANTDQAPNQYEERQAA